jgi:DOPA 4,5-dioxygenase
MGAESVVTSQATAFADTATIRNWHAHVYYQPDTRETAAALRDGIALTFPDAVLGRWHDVPVGPHTRPMYQVAFAADRLAAILPWLMLNRRGLVLLVHPETGHDLADHTEHAGWLGERLPLKLEVLSEHRP